MDAFNCDVVYRSTKARKLNHLHPYCEGHIVLGAKIKFGIQGDLFVECTKWV